MRAIWTTAGVATALACSVAWASGRDEVFAPGDHCVGYRTTKGMFFDDDVPVVGRSCDVTASLVEGSDVRIVVEVPATSLDSGNFLRDGAVAELLGADVQPRLLYTSEPLDPEALRVGIERGGISVPGTLRMGEQDFPVVFPIVFLVEGDARFAAGTLETRFDAFGVEVPTVALGLLARPHETLELLVHLDLDRIDGLSSWAASQQLW